MLDRTGAKRVISSHRRISKLTVLNLLSAACFTRHDVADDWCTPFLLSPSPNTSVRGQEIDQHLVHNRPAGCVILDDGPVLPSQAKNFVQTDPSKGRTDDDADQAIAIRSDEHTSELQPLMRSTYADFSLKKKRTNQQRQHE